MKDGTDVRLGELIGRERELAALTGWLESARRGRPRLVLCTGEPGIGKTRLAFELAEAATAQSVPSRWGRAPEGVAPAPFWLWRQVLGADPSALVASGAEDPEEARFALFAAVTDRLRADAERDGLLIVLDDLQRADESSLLLLQHLVRELREARMMIVATERTVASEPTPGWEAVRAALVQEPVTDQVHLRGLSLDDTIRCVASVTGVAVDERDGRALHQTTKGNPFFVTELARARTTGDAVPGSVLEVVARRVERLPVAASRLLAAAAVLGEQFPLPVAAALVDRPAMACLPVLEAAARAGLVEPTSQPGDWRFSHALVRDALEERIPLADRVELHRAAAEAIERTYAGQLDERLADLARHWSVVATTGERDNAVRWARTAAAEAMRALAFEESARLYRLALDAAGRELGDEARCRVLLDLAQAEWRSGHLEASKGPCVEVVERARSAGRPDLLAEAALTLEPIGALAWDLDIVLWCKEAVVALDEHDLPARARVLARLTEASVYVGEDEAAHDTSAVALSLADETDDVAAVVAALRARQLALSAPEHTGERMRLAHRMIDTGVLLRRPSIEMWGRLWRIDAHWERGALSEIAAEASRLEWCAAHVGGPVARWHALVAKAALAQATARFDEARAIGRQAFESVQSIRHPSAFGAMASLMCTLGHHTGHEWAWGDLLGPATAPPPAAGEVRTAIFGYLGPAYVLVESGRQDEALAAFRGAGPVERWHPPPYFRVLSWAIGLAVAIGLDQRADVEFLLPHLDAERGRHAVGGAGNAAYNGPVELYLGRAEAYLGMWTRAEEDLRAAAERCRAIGAIGFAAEADCELAHVLAQQGATREAAARATAAKAEAARVGMPPWERRAEAVLAALGAADGAPEPLSRRELEVAALVAQGMTNRAIAEALFLSERTAQTHVQHILTKLGFANRSQIAAWVASQRGDSRTNT